MIAVTECAPDVKFSYVELRERITKAREMADISQAELARRLGISRSAVTQWESGGAGISAHNLIQVADATHVSARWLISETGPASQPAAVLLEVAEIIRRIPPEQLEAVLTAVAVKIAEIEHKENVSPPKGQPAQRGIRAQDRLTAAQPTGRRHSGEKKKRSSDGNQ